MQISDNELMQRIKNEDITAFDILVKRWEHRLYNFVYKVTNSKTGIAEKVENMKSANFDANIIQSERLPSLNNNKSLAIIASAQNKSGKSGYTK